jgi:hypothetical protein
MTYDSAMQATATDAVQPELHLFIDETVLERHDGQRLVGAGVLATSRSVSDEIVHEALAALRDDPDRAANAPCFDPRVEALDARTLARGYFHASEDSKNARSWLSRGICKRLSGAFYCSFDVVGTAGDEKSFRSRSTSSLFTPLVTRKHAFITFEERSSFRRRSADELMERIWRGLDWNSFQHFLMATFYPRLTIGVAPKQNPGLQVTDLLLWAVAQREYRAASKKTVWADRCGLHPLGSAHTEGEHREPRWLVFGVNRREYDVAYDPTIRPSYPVETEAILSAELDFGLAFRLFRDAVEVLRRACQEPLPAHAAHLHGGLHNAVAGFARACSPTTVREMCRQFVRLFDTLPLYGDATSAADWHQLLLTKRALALTLRKDLVDGEDLPKYFVQEWSALRPNP